MANYSSIARRFVKPTSNINHQYIDATLKDKQQTIDSNFGFMQESIEKVLGQDLARGQDREYLKEKMSSVLSSLDNTGSIKFDSKKAKYSIQDTLSEVGRDPEILRQLMNTRKVRQIQAFKSERSNGKSKLGAVNEGNFNYALQKSGMQEYMSGEDVDMGDFNYSEYSDYDKHAAEITQKLKASLPNEMVSIEDPNTGEIRSYKKSMLSEQQIQSYIRSRYTDADIKQMEIDGAMKYGMSDENAFATRDANIAQVKGIYQKEIDRIELNKKTGGLTHSQIIKEDEKIKGLQTKMSNYEVGMLSQKTAETIGKNEIMQNRLDLYSKLYSQDGPMSVKYNATTLKYLRDKHDEELEKKTQEENGYTPLTVGTDLAKELNLVGTMSDASSKAYKSASDAMTSAFNNLKGDHKKTYLKTRAELLQNKDFTSNFKNGAPSEAVLQEAIYEKIGGRVFSPDVVNNILKTKAEADVFRESYNKLDTLHNTSTVVSEEFYKTIKGAQGLVMMLPNSKGVVEEVNVNKYLKDNFNISNKSTYKTFIESDTPEAKAFISTMALQAMSLTMDLSWKGLKRDFSKTDQEKVWEKLGQREDMSQSETATIDITASELRTMKTASINITGSPLTDTYDIEKVGKGYTLHITDQNTAFAKVVAKTNNAHTAGARLYGAKKGLQAGALVGGALMGGPGSAAIAYTAVAEGVGFSTARTIRNTSMGDKFSDDARKETVLNNSELIPRTVAGATKLRVQVGTPLYEELVNRTQGTNFLKNKVAKPLDIFIDPRTNRLDVRQTTKGATTTKNAIGQTVTTKKEENVGYIEAADLINMPEYNKVISTQGKKTVYSSLESTNLKRSNMFFINESGNEKDNQPKTNGLLKLYNKPTEVKFQNYSTEIEARKAILTDSNVSELRKTQEGVLIEQQFEKFLTHTQDYELTFSKNIATPYKIEIWDTSDSKRKLVGDIPIASERNYESIIKAYRATPQVFLALYSEREVAKYLNKLNSTSNRR